MTLSPPPLPRQSSPLTSGEAARVSVAPFRPPGMPFSLIWVHSLPPNTGQSTGRHLPCFAWVLFKSGGAPVGEGRRFDLLWRLRFTTRAFHFPSASRTIQSTAPPLSSQGLRCCIRASYALARGGAAVVSIPDVLKHEPLRFHSSSSWERTQVLAS